MSQLQRLVIASSQFSGAQIHLTPEQQHYLQRVLRLQAGDRFIAMDGKGWWLAVLTSADLTQATLVEPIAVSTELPVEVTLVMAMPKTGMEEIVRQTTELGVSRIIPVISQRTLLKPSAHKLDRWQRIAQEASEQSERQVIPKIIAPLCWTEVLTDWNGTHSSCYLCEARGNHPLLLRHLMAAISPTSSGLEGSISCSSPPSDSAFPSTITIAIGPEGGWTEAEIQAAIAVGYQPVSLGPQILRAVTAPVVVMSLIASTTVLKKEEEEKRKSIPGELEK